MWGFRGSPFIEGCSLGKPVGVREATYTGQEWARMCPLGESPPISSSWVESTFHVSISPQEHRLKVLVVNIKPYQLAPPLRVKRTHRSQGELLLSIVIYSARNFRASDDKSGTRSLLSTLIKWYHHQVTWLGVIFPAVLPNEHPLLLSNSNQSTKKPSIQLLVRLPWWLSR